jgi:hypothetical protein
MLLHGEELSDPAIVLLHDALGCMATWKEFPHFGSLMLRGWMW